MLENITGQEIKKQFKSNKKLRLTTFIVGGLALITLGYFVYLQFMWKPSNEESKEKYWVGLNYAVKDSTDAALDELKRTKNKYEGMIGGEVAQFVYARQLMNKGEYKNAIKELEDVSTDDTYTPVFVLGLQGDCYSELEDYVKAGNLYVEAAELVENQFTSPYYLKKAALCAEAVNDFESATTYYQKIKDDYTAFANQNQIEKYLARASSRKTGK